MNFTAFDNRSNSNWFDNGGPYTFNGHRYYIETSSQNWNNANNAATTAGGYLFVPNSEEELEFIESQIGGNWSWIGIYQDNTDPTYTADQILSLIHI